MTSSAEGESTLLVAPAELGGRTVTVRGGAHHHLFRARRLAVGERLRVVDGGGRARAGRISEVGRAAAAIELGPELPSREPEVDLTLLVGALRPQRAAWLVEKATELGVVAVRFLASSRTPRALAPAGLERLRRVAAAALEQCGRARLPEVSGVHGWEELPALLAPAAQRWVCQPGPPPPPGGAGAASAVLVGPEGGWSAGELEELAALGCRRLGLGPRPLRVETAALAAAALLLLPAAVSVDTAQAKG